MKHIRFFRILTVVAIMALLATTLAGAVPAAQATTARVIVRGTSLDVAVSAVQAVGGRVTDKIDIINAVVADVPQASVNASCRTRRVFWVSCPIGP